MSKALIGGLLVALAMAIAAPLHGQQAQSPLPSGPPAVGPTTPGKPSVPQRPSEPSKKPKPELERPTVWGEPTQVRIGIYVVDIDEISSANQSFAGSVYLEAHWNIPALKHKGPGPLQRPWTEVWTPRLVIVNSQQAWRAFPESVEILPSGEAIYRQLFWGKFSQPMDLRDFPEDEQKLTIQVAAVGLEQSEVQMVPLFKKNIGIAPSFSLPDFDVVSWKAGSHPYVVIKNESETAGYRMEIKVRRHTTYYIIKIIIPLCLILIMSWGPRWIDPNEIGANLGISATAFLTLIAYLFAINVLLPPVSYVTRMDRFILLSTFMVFAGLVQTVLTTALVRRGRGMLASGIDLWSRALYPVLLGLVLAISFIK